MKTGIELVKDLYKLFGQGNIPAVLEILHPEVDWTIFGPQGYPFFGNFKGREGFSLFLTGLGEATNITNFQPETFTDAGTTVIVTGFEEANVKHNQNYYKVSWCHIFEVEGEYIVRFQEYLDSGSIVKAYDGNA